MTDWDALFEYLDDGHTHVQAAKKFGIHTKSISRKKKEIIDKKGNVGNNKGNKGNVTIIKRIFVERIPDIIREKFIGAYAAHLLKYPSESKRYARFGYGNFIDATEVMNDFFRLLKKEVDKK